MANVISDETIEYVGILAQFCDVSYGISCLGPCPEAFCSDVDSIRTVVNRGNAALNVLCRSKEL